MDAAEDVPLPRIGVLEFVDQQQRPAFGQRGGERRILAGAPHRFDQLILGAFAAQLHLRRETRLCVCAQRVQRGGGLGFVRARQRGARRVAEFRQILRQRGGMRPHLAQQRVLRGIAVIAGRAAPQLRRDFVPRVGRAVDQFDIGQQSRAETEFAQRTLAEAVDGGDQRFVQLRQRRAETVAQRCGVDRCTRLREYGFRGVRFAVVVVRRCAVQHFLCGEQTLPQPFAQLLRGRAGEGDRQQLLDRHAALQQQAQQHRDQREGLAGASAGLDQAQAVQRQREAEIAAVAGRLRAMIGRAHACVSSASKIARATSPKSRARALSTASNKPCGRNASASHASADSPR